MNQIVAQYLFVFFPQIKKLNLQPSNSQKNLQILWNMLSNLIDFFRTSVSGLSCWPFSLLNAWAHFFNCGQDSGLLQKTLHKSDTPRLNLSPNIKTDDDAQKSQTNLSQKAFTVVRSDIEMGANPCRYYSGNFVFLEQRFSNYSP